MRPPLPVRPATVALLLAGTVLFTAITARAADVPAERWNVAGRTYERVRVMSVTAEAVMIAHAGGMTQFDLATLPVDLQQRFGYDAAASAAAAREAQAQLEATAELQRRALEIRKRLAEQESEERAAREREAAVKTNFDFANVAIRESVDLRPFFTEHNLHLKFQGARPECAIYALVCALEYEYARSFGVDESFSEGYLVWAVNESRPGTPTGGGYHFVEILDAVTEHGVARLALVPWNVNTRHPDFRPTEETLADARSRRGFNVNYYRNGDRRQIERIIDALNRETPVVIGIRWPHWNTIKRQSLLRDQDPRQEGGHAVTIIGYRSTGSMDSVEFLFRNSYGAEWGVGGCGWMSLGYLKANLITAFSITVPTAPSPPPG